MKLASPIRSSAPGSFSNVATAATAPKDLREPVVRVEDWLLHSGVALAEGDHRGGVAGWLDDQGKPEFVYLEIVGYYLTTMAWLASGAASSPANAETARQRAVDAAAWIERVLDGPELPPTRWYLEPRADWRNEAVFTFDLAMAARGLGQCARLGVVPRRTLDRLCDVMNQISRDSDILASHVLTGAGPELGPRWSTRPGPHHLKAAAGVAGLPDWAATGRLAAVAERTCRHWTTALDEGDWPCLETHALLYGLEGILNAPGLAALDAAERIYIRLMESQSSDGTLAERVDLSSADGGRVRSDVLAQALRIGLLLRARGYLADAQWGERLDRLADALVGFVRFDGGLLFAKDQTISNAWCAMFAHQALYLHAHQNARNPLSDDLFRLASRLVV